MSDAAAPPQQENAETESLLHSDVSPDGRGVAVGQPKAQRIASKLSAGSGCPTTFGKVAKRGIEHASLP